MSIRVGNTNIAKLYYGSTEIAKVYAGTELIYESRPVLAKYEIGSPVASDVIATLYADGELVFDGSGNMKTFSFDTPWYDDRNSITTISFKEGNTIQPINIATLFYGLTNIASIDLSNFDTSNVTNMSSMFGSCPNLITIEGLSNFDTSNVTDMSNMFRTCNSLMSLDLSSFNTSKVTNMSGMFYICPSLTSIEGLSNFDTSSVTDMSMMFYNCNSLTSSITIMNPNITSYTEMFSGCSILSDAEFIVYYTDGCKEVAKNMVNTKSSNSNVILNILVVGTYEIGNPVASDVVATLYDDGLLEFDGTGDIQTFSMFPNAPPWHYDRNSITSVSFKQGNTIQPVRMSFLFYNFSNVTSMNLLNLDTSNVRYTDYMFSGCSSLTELDLSSFNTSQVLNMGSMFYGCKNLQALDLSSFDMTNVTSTMSMFSGCKSLTSSIVVNNPDRIQCINMFRDCSTLEGSEFIVYYEEGCLGTAELMIETKSDNSNVYLGINVDLVANSSSVTTEITPDIINIISETLLDYYSNNIPATISSILITLNNDANLYFSITIMTSVINILYDKNTKTYTYNRGGSGGGRN